MKHLPLLFAFLSGSAFADWNVQIACDATNNWLRIGDMEALSWPTEREFIKLTEAAGPSFRYSSRKSGTGNPFRLLGRYRSYHCGDLKVVTRSEYLNENPDGEDGVYEFISASIYWHNKLIVPKTGFLQCDVFMNSRAYFGNCPENFARSVEVSKGVAKGTFSVVIHREYRDKLLTEQTILDSHISN